MAQRRQTYEQANNGRMSPMASMQFGRDLHEAARNGSPQARRRARLLGRAIIVLFLVIPVTLLVLTEVLN